MSRLWVGALVLALAGCDGAEDSDTDVDPDTERPVEQGCDEVTVFVDGPEEPRVDDEWTVLLRCDGTTLTGPMVLRIDPSDLAFLEENTLRFLRQGEGIVRAQVGSFRAERPVTVGR